MSEERPSAALEVVEIPNGLKEEISNLFFHGLRAKVSNEQRDDFLRSLSLQLGVWIFLLKENDYGSLETEVVNEIQKIDMVVRELHECIGIAHPYTRDRLNGQSRFVYADVLDIDALLEQLLHLKLTTEALVKEDLEYNDGTSRYGNSHLICLYVRRALKSSGINVKFTRNEDSPFVRLFALILKIKEVKDPLLLVTDEKYRDTSDRAMTTGDTMNLALGLARAHDTWLDIEITRQNESATQNDGVNLT
jgi:hypothetical protein